MTRLFTFCIGSRYGWTYVGGLPIDVPEKIDKDFWETTTKMIAQHHNLGNFTVILREASVCGDHT